MSIGATAETQDLRSAEESTVETRANIYKFLAEVFTSRPTPAMVQSVRDMAQVLGLTCRDGWSLDDLAQDYSALFVVPGPRYVAPYESVYRDALESRAPGHGASGPAASPQGARVKGLLMGDSTLEVQACYREAAVFPEGEIPDHIGNELRFMAYLCLRRATATENSERLADLQTRFRTEHLLTWLGLLGQRIRESETVGFYSLVAQVAEIVLQDEM